MLHHPRGCFGYLQFLGNFLVRIPLRPQVYHAAGALILLLQQSLHAAQLLAGGGQALPQSLPAPDDARLLQKIRHKYNTGLLMFAALGMGFGVLTSYGEHSNWIILIFPFVCAAAVYQDPQMWKLLMAVGEGIALCALLRTFVRYWQYGATLMEYPVTLIVYSVFMLGLCGVGCLIGWLLNYASGKGEKKHESEK